MNTSLASLHQGAEDCCYGDRLSEHPAVHHHSEDSLSHNKDRLSVSVPHGLRELPADGGGGAHCDIQVPSKVQAERGR